MSNLIAGTRFTFLSILTWILCFLGVIQSVCQAKILFDVAGSWTDSGTGTQLHAT